MTTGSRDSLVWKLAGLLRESGDVVLAGCSTLSLLTRTLQQLNHVFELYLGPWGPGQKGFVALPSHPADSPIILQLQFLFDVLQKTLSLKLVHVPGPGLPAPIKIFPFKSLRTLELRGIPLSRLHGLRSIYSQLETLICHKSLQALEDLLSSCGGDFCSALPWLALQSADFSYNTLTALDSSLSLLSAVRFLNLSHNRVQDCEDFLRDLSELCHLDISYNHLLFVPRMGPSRAALGTLILRGNELQSLHGLEQLQQLRHLDLAYNLLEAHVELGPLHLLTELRKLYLEGNPLWFHPLHRAATASYLSPRARDKASGFLLDGECLSLSDLQASTSSELGPATPVGSWLVGSATETSAGADLSDSPSSGAAPPLRKAKNRVRVRRASISELSDTDPEPRTLDPSPASWFAQQHRELELMNSFRERFGQDWLQYRSHLGTPGTPVLVDSLPPAPGPLSMDGLDPEAPPGSVLPKEALQDMDEEPGVQLEPQEEEKLEEHVEEEKEEEEELELSEGEAELCRPILVCPLEGPQGVRGRECFLRLTSGYLLEVELQAARVLERLELGSLEEAGMEAELEPEPVAQASEQPPRPPILTLRFSYICPARHFRRYVILEPDAHAAIQELLAVLTPVVTSTRCHLGEKNGSPRGHLQCLRCGHDFKAEEPGSFQKADLPVVCPNCGSDHVVLLTRPAGPPLGDFPELAAPSQSPSSIQDAPDHGDLTHTASSAPSPALVPQEPHSWSLSPPPERSGLCSVDHRLRLFLDVEVFTGAQEEFQCCIKVPVVLAGQPGECLCVVAVSDHSLYVLKVTGEICGPPASWLQPTLAIPLQDLSAIELGLAGQSLRLVWMAGTGSCMLLPRDAKSCRAFLGVLMDVLQALPPPRRSGISASEEEVTPEHRLWPLLERDSSSEPPPFFYLRVFLVEGPTTRPVSLLLTLSILYLLEEDLTGTEAGPPLPAEACEKASPVVPESSVQILEQQPLSSLSSVLLYRTAPQDLRLIFYEEVSRRESFWALRVVCPEQLTALLAWVREPWEELFSIGLRTATQEALDLDR
ncbi:serine/threonine-protein kinase 11-interacting protein [Suncus etruscus]|uniref:serine/threonine-protein kinase 11-interacting protein n=1 Tax=Suncus etruscus TaxID=109475 RepID=UPI00210FFCB9|nr:serine/threonine-protein kinase 11-interacting protein [Suncus etruscus]